MLRAADAATSRSRGASGRPTGDGAGPRGADAAVADAGRPAPADRSAWAPSDARAYAADGEGPIHVVELSPSAIDAARGQPTPSFAAFVDATGHVTEAERFGWSFVFAGFLPDDFPDTRAVGSAPWWRQVYGADWRHPDGPQSRPRRPRRPPGRPRLVERRPGVLRVERRRACRPRPSGSTPPAAVAAASDVPVGRRARARRPAPDERVPGHASRPTNTVRRRLRRRRHRSTPSRPTGSGCTT